MRYKEIGTPITKAEFDRNTTKQFFTRDFRKISLRNLMLNDTHFYSCTFIGVDFRNSCFVNCTFDSSNFSFANLEGAKILSSNLRWTRFCGANLRETDLSDSNLTYSNFDGVFLENSIISAEQIASVRGHIKMAGTWRHVHKFEP
jgi:uncharacterized protein YjbI with pentapeptide repeats